MYDGFLSIHRRYGGFLGPRSLFMSLISRRPADTECDTEAIKMSKPTY